MGRVYLRIGIFLLLASAGLSAQAHKVNMFAYAEGNEVFVEGYFNDGKKTMKCEVIVYDVNKQPVLEGLTNDEGQFSFVIPAPGALRITLNAGEGHMAEYLLSADETAADEGVTAEASIQSGAAVVVSETADGSTAPNNTQIQSMVRKAVSQAIHPVMRALDELKSQRTISDIIGGIGIIMGVGGLLLYFQARKLAQAGKPEQDGGVK